MAIKSLLSTSSSLRSIQNSIKTISSGMVKSSVLSKKIAENINKDNVFKRKILDDDQSFFARRRESYLRRRKEEEVEAGESGNILKKQGNVIKSTMKGFLGKIMNFFAITLMGWLIINLPKIIKGINSLVKRIGNVVGVLRNFVNTIVVQFTGMGKDLDKINSQILGVNFQEQQDKIKDSVDENQKQLDQISSSYSKTVSDYSQFANEMDEMVPPEPECPEGFTWDVKRGQCIPDDEDSYWNNIIDWLYNDRRGDSDKEQDIDNNDNNDVALFASGGVVKGPGGVDNVDAKLTAGEFVMTKKAVNKWGIGFFESLNSMVGGKNDGHLTGRYEEGGVVTEEQNKINEETLGKLDEKIEGLVASLETKRGTQKRALGKRIARLKAEREKLIEQIEIYRKSTIKPGWISVDEYLSMSDTFSGISTSSSVSSDESSSNLITSITGLQSELESTAKVIEPIIKSSDFDGIKNEMVELAEYLQGSVNAKRIIIPIPMVGTDGSGSSAVPVGSGSGNSVRSKGVNSSREMYHNLITLITSYT